MGFEYKECKEIASKVQVSVAKKTTWGKSQRKASNLIQSIFQIYSRFSFLFS